MLAFLAPLLALGSKVVPFFTGINFGSFFSGVGNALKALGQNIITNWKVWLIGLLIAAQVGTAYGFYHEHVRYVTEKAAHAADNAKFVAAQKAADLEEQNVRKQLQTESKAASHEADTNYSALLTKYNASLMRYGSGKGGVQGPSNNQLPATQGADGPSASTDLSSAVSSLPTQIAITGSDAEVCAVNTARLQAAHDWAIQQLQTEKQNDTQTIQGAR